MTRGASPIHVILRLSNCIRRPEGQSGAREEKKKDKACFSITSSVTVLHASTPPDCDFFPAHRLPPFNEIPLISSSNEPLIEVRTRDRCPSGAGSSNSLFTVMNFDNAILISLPPSKALCGNTTQIFDINEQICLCCPPGTEEDRIELEELYDRKAMIIPIIITVYSIQREGSHGVQNDVRNRRRSLCGDGGGKLRPPPRGGAGGYGIVGDSRSGVTATSPGGRRSCTRRGRGRRRRGGSRPTV